MMEHQVQWIAPVSLWSSYFGADTDEERALVHQPHILRFATDSFMDEFMTMLQHQPERLAEWVVQPEEWRAPASNPGPIDHLPPLIQRLHRMKLATALPLERLTAALAPAPSNDGLEGKMIIDQGSSDLPLKLYQPAHMRFYLVTACLVCRIPGLPDRMLNFGAGERVSYVIRRLRPKEGMTALPSEYNLNTCDEYAFVDGKTWQKASADDLVLGEEQNPMFGVTYLERDGRKRRMLAAPIPVGKREAYMGAAAAPIITDPDVDAGKLVTDPRVALLKRTITEPWRSIFNQNKHVLDRSTTLIPGGLGDATNTNATRTALTPILNDQATWLSWLILLDFSDYLEDYLPRLWSVINSQLDEEDLTDDEASLLTQMRNTADTASGVELIDALIDIRDFRDGLEYETTPFTNSGTPSDDLVWPDFVFRLNDPGVRTMVGLDAAGNVAPDNLDQWIADILQQSELPPHTPPLPQAARMTTNDMREAGWFIIRCIFERPNCVPAMGSVISEPSQPFQMAAFFDPQAPARPIQVNLPLDITPAGLRKFDRNTAFVVSDALCKQINRMGNITLGDLVLSVLPWPFHKDLPNVAGSGVCQDEGIDIGMICSLSIPIITICALILLIIMVSLFHLIFHWLPFFIMCFPVPKLKAKGA